MIELYLIYTYVSMHFLFVWLIVELFGFFSRISKFSKVQYNIESRLVEVSMVNVEESNKTVGNK